MTEGNFPCSAIFLEGLPKLEVSPSLVGGRLVVEDVDVGELMGSRQICHTSEGEVMRTSIPLLHPQPLLLELAHAN